MTIIMLCTTAHAQVSVKSFYFSNTGNSLTEYSEKQLLKLIQSQGEYNLQVIELNAFSNLHSSYKGNKEICTARVNMFIQRLHLEDEEMTTVNYGSRRIPLNFKAVNWNRIDIYYNLTAKDDSIVHSIPDSDLVIIVPQEAATEVRTFKEVPDAAEIVRDIPISTPIEFKGGKTKIDQKSLAYIDHLYRTLDKNPDLTAHIRGHVCCGSNKRVSKKRAKSVYKRLRLLGIDKDRLSFHGYSNTLPVVFPEIYAADRKRNRRVDIIFK